jgi:type II restriction enzyme
MDLHLELPLASAYRGPTQRVKILSEQWVATWVYCPNCGNSGINRYKNNTPVADFLCPECQEDYELKAHGRSLGPTIVDGAYKTMMERLASRTNPNLLLLEYDRGAMHVRNLVVIPKHFFISSLIEVRRPLAPTARRAGWIGCKIRLADVPAAGRVFLIKDGAVEDRADVRDRWRRMLFLRDQRYQSMKGWLLSVMRIVDGIRKETFSLRDVYAFESELMSSYPDNSHIRPKIRQQLQVLRDSGYLVFLGDGKYRLRK